MPADLLAAWCHLSQDTLSRSVRSCGGFTTNDKSSCEPMQTLPSTSSQAAAARVALSCCGPQVEKETALNMGQARLSGNPVMWRQPNGTDVLLGMVHARAAR